MGLALRLTPAAEARAILDAAMSEDELLTQVLKLAKLQGWWVHHVRDSKKGVTQGETGFPDLVLVRPAHVDASGRVLSPAKVLYRELKREHDRTAPARRSMQEAWGRLLTAAGCDWRVWRPSDWPDIEATLRGYAGGPL